jgi:hypothetical protein
MFIFMFMFMLFPQYVTAHPLPSGHHLHHLTRTDASLRFDYLLLVDKEITDIFMKALDTDQNRNISPSEASSWFDRKMGRVTIMVNGQTPESAFFRYGYMEFIESGIRMTGSYEIPIKKGANTEITIRDQGFVTPMDDFFFEANNTQISAGAMALEVTSDPDLNYGAIASIIAFMDRPVKLLSREVNLSEKFLNWQPPVQGEMDKSIPDIFDSADSAKAASHNNAAPSKTASHGTTSEIQANAFIEKSGAAICILIFLILLSSLISRGTSIHSAIFSSLPICLCLYLAIVFLFLPKNPFRSNNLSGGSEFLAVKSDNSDFSKQFTHIHGALYRQYDLLKSENTELAGPLYTILADSLSGTALEEEHLKSFKRLMALKQAKVKVSILKIDYNKVHLYPQTAFCAWQVTTQIDHMNHSHQRTYAFSGNFNLLESNGTLKITSMNISSSRRIN